MSIIKIADFKGYNRLAKAIDTDPNLQAFIDKYEPLIIYQLFGVKMGKLIIAYLNANRLPINVDYDKVIDAFAEEGNGSDEWYYQFNTQWISEGLFSILKSQIYYQYVCGTAVQHTQAGTTFPEVDTQKGINPSRLAESRHNDSLSSWEAIQMYIIENRTLYPDYIFLRRPSSSFSGIL